MRSDIVNNSYGHDVLWHNTTALFNKMEKIKYTLSTHYSSRIIPNDEVKSWDYGHDAFYHETAEIGQLRIDDRWILCFIMIVSRYWGGVGDKQKFIILLTTLGLVAPQFVFIVILGTVQMSWRPVEHYRLEDSSTVKSWLLHANYNHRDCIREDV